VRGTRVFSVRSPGRLVLEDLHDGLPDPEFRIPLPTSFEEEARQELAQPFDAGVEPGKKRKVVQRLFTEPSDDVFENRVHPAQVQQKPFGIEAGALEYPFNTVVVRVNGILRSAVAPQKKVAGTELSGYSDMKHKASLFASLNRR
jgi:hypothetical protein